MVHADLAQLGRVFRNLYDNAIRHSPAGGEVTTEVVLRDDAVVVTVRDQGPGFPDDIRETAFEAFTRGDPARNIATGTAGLGLAIARGIVEAHGGAIELGNGPGGAVQVFLPRPAH